jgi:opacity protein-like surface antigen
MSRRMSRFDSQTTEVSGNMIRKILLAIAGTALVSMASAQAVDAVKESSKAAAEGTKHGVDNAKAAVHSEPKKSAYKAQARVHKAKARYHRQRAKAAADAAVH